MESIFELLTKEQHQLIHICTRDYEDKLPPFEEALKTVPFSNGYKSIHLKKTVYRHGSSNIYYMLTAANELIQRVGKQNATLFEELGDFTGIDKYSLIVETTKMLYDLIQCFYPDEGDSRSYLLDEANVSDYFMEIEER